MSVPVDVDDAAAAVTEMLKKFGFEDGTTDQLCFQINPPTAEVKVVVKKVGKQRQGPGMTLKPNKEGVVDLACLADNIDYEVEIFTLTTPMISLHKFVTRKSPKGVDVRGVDTGATLIQSLFKSKDQPLADGIVLGEYIDKDGNKHKLNGKTSKDGSFSMLLPPGTVKNMKATSQDGTIEIPKRGSIKIPQSYPTRSLRKTKSIKIEVNPSSFASAVSPKGDLVILGDISASMEEIGMPILRKSYTDLVEKALTEKRNLALGVWDSLVDWFSESWINPSEKQKVLDFISKLDARGGNDMRYAIEDAVRKFPDATDIYVMCDGDISPFTINGGITTNLVDVPKPSSAHNESSNTVYNNTSWDAFRKRFPTINFHFIALGNESQSKAMEEMANIGNGNFWESSST